MGGPAHTRLLRAGGWEQEPGGLGKSSSRVLLAKRRVQERKGSWVLGLWAKPGTTQNQGHRDVGSPLQDAPDDHSLGHTATCPLSVCILSPRHRGGLLRALGQVEKTPHAPGRVPGQVSPTPSL